MNWRGFCMKLDALTTEQAAEVLGLKAAVFKQLRRAAGLPDPVLKKANACFYDRDELVLFAANNDVAKIIKDTRQQIRSGGKSIRQYNYTGKHKKIAAKPVVKPAKQVVADSLINRFIRGDFLPQEQQSERQAKLNKARLNPPQRVVVHFRGDWHEL